jgi:hypothetical protein
MADYAFCNLKMNPHPKFALTYVPDVDVDDKKLLAGKGQQLGSGNDVRIRARCRSIFEKCRARATEFDEHAKQYCCFDISCSFVVGVVIVIVTLYLERIFNLLVSVHLIIKSNGFRSNKLTSNCRVRANADLRRGA